nr:hypothetical protein [uncultured Acetatifactor sp.]
MRGSIGSGADVAEMQKCGNTETQKCGKAETRKCRNTETQKHRNTETQVYFSEMSGALWREDVVENLP